MSVATKPMRRASSSILAPNPSKIALPSTHDALTSSRRPSAISRQRRASFTSTGSGSILGTGIVPTHAEAPNSKQALRTSKNTTKLVVLPSEPQTVPLPAGLVAPDDDGSSETLLLDSRKGRTDTKSAGERMTRAERERAGFKRLTAYCVSEGMRMQLLSAFLRREHNVVPRVFDEALYAMYHLPLLSGYDRHVNVRSSTAIKMPFLKRLSDAEENGYQGPYFTQDSNEANEEYTTVDGFIPSSSPQTALLHNDPPPSETRALENKGHEERTGPKEVEAKPRGGGGGAVHIDENVAEAVFFAYGVVVFFGFTEDQEKMIIDDLDNALVLVRKIGEDKWEKEECHFSYDPEAAYPRIYNDLFTFKSPSHLLTISVAHSLAQSTLLARYETRCTQVLSDPRTTAIPRTLATTGELRLRRRDALRLTGRLFQLRRDINLVSNVLDVPKLFWSEASLKDLYDAVREYMEIGQRVGVLNEKLAVASDLLDLIHNHLNGNAMERITWIIIWLIVAACLVELGEVLARLVVHATGGGGNSAGGRGFAFMSATRPISSIASSTTSLSFSSLYDAASQNIFADDTAVSSLSSDIRSMTGSTLSREDALAVLEKIMQQQQRQ